MKAFIDRFTDEQQAVLLIESLNKEIIMPLANLPNEAKPGLWVNLVEESGSFRITSIDQALTNKKKTQINSLMNNLQQRKKTSKYKK